MRLHKDCQKIFSPTCSFQNFILSPPQQQQQQHPSLLHQQSNVESVNWTHNHSNCLFNSNNSNNSLSSYYNNNNTNNNNSYFTNQIPVVSEPLKINKPNTNGKRILLTNRLK